MSKIAEEIDVLLTALLLRLLDCLGPGRIGDRCRGAVLRFCGYGFGERVTVSPGLTLKSRCDPVVIGANCYLNREVYFDAGNSITIGQSCDIGFRTIFTTSGHRLVSDRRGRRPVMSRGPIVVDDFVWIGANVTILGGVTIGEGSVVGAGSVVTKDVPANSLAVGAPARVVRDLGAIEELVS
ncbi:MAG: acyltransferase [Chthoniobacter sp.]|uniref:acyltransferase n=1 Tax=Chthoniobacter sp. TaxID=2510640 RepID=UPI0032A6C912